MRKIPVEVLDLIQEHFHAVIRGRVDDLVKEHRPTLPDLREFVDSGEREGWFPVPGMAAGFAYLFQGRGKTLRLVATSWCRMVHGSGQRHEITREGSHLVAEGFV